MKQRILSAIVGLSIFLAVYFSFHERGLKLLCFVIVVLGIRELIGLLFHPDDSLFLKVLFSIFTTLIFAITLRFPSWSPVVLSLGTILFFSSSILYRKRFENLDHLSNFQSKSSLGFLYLGVLPAIAASLLDFQQGQAWFLSLLFVVFAGDSGAYFTGRLWGEKKVMPDISPKKTWAGVWGGLLCSIAAGGISSFMMEGVPPGYIMLLAGIAGLIGQLGDLFESALKRVAQIKDSGHLMPGHGGILDRIDGVLFAAPVFFVGAQLLEKAF